MRILIILSCLFILCEPSFGQHHQKMTAPNIIFILADDLGYGDVSCLNKESKIATPNIDRLATEGMSFTDAHSSSAVCTPSRYSILTGRYAWRTRLKNGVLTGYSEPLIASNRLTVGEMLQSRGYTTACIGKWHLGLSWPKKQDSGTEYDYSARIKDGPLNHGFNYFFGISASLDMPPFIYIENDHTLGIPDTVKTWVRPGPAAKDFEAENCVPDFTAKAEEFIKKSSLKGKPFFLYFPLPSPHTPIVPTAAFRNKSGVTAYGDYVQETDWSVGRLLRTLEENNLTDNTIVIFTSDNGFAPYVLDKYNVEALGHLPSYIFRGYKSDIWEGGHRVPFIVRWPGQIKAGSTCRETICLSDFMATSAAIAGVKIPDDAAEDSYNILPYFKSRFDKSIREATVHHSINGNFAIRQGKWKLELGPGSGGWSKPTDQQALRNGLPTVQLYDMWQDVRERSNVQAQYPVVVQEMTSLLKRYVDEGRSTPGSKSKNDSPVDIWNLRKRN